MKTLYTGTGQNLGIKVYFPILPLTEETLTLDNISAKKQDLIEI